MATDTAQMMTYSAKKWDLSGLRGISDKTLEMHFGLYEGYVKNTNLLREEIAHMRAGKESGADPKFAELVRRLGFEYNGMRLHELYFDNLTAKPGEILQGGHVAGFNPILVMDVWEHAFMLDYKPSDRAKYVEAFLAHVNWDLCEGRT